MGGETITAEIAITKFQQLLKRIPKLRRFVGQRLLLKVVERGVANILGGVMPATHENRELSEYFTASMQTRVRDDGKTFATGLLSSDERARILAFRNTGGTIYPKQDRKNPHLRIPLPPALYESSGKDRFAGVLLRKLPEASNPFTIEKVPGGNAFLVKKDDVGRTRMVDVPRHNAFQRQEQVAEAAPAERWYELVKSKYYPPEPWWDTTVDQVTAEGEAVVSAAVEAFRLFQAERKESN